MRPKRARQGVFAATRCSLEKVNHPPNNNLRLNPFKHIPNNYLMILIDTDLLVPKLTDHMGRRSPLGT